MSKRDNRYHYKECGLDNIYLRNGFKYHDTPRGKRIQIFNPEGLHRAIGEMLVLDKKYLSGRDLRFLRHELNMTQQVLGNLIGVDAQTVARWEKEQTEIPGPADRVIRLLYSEKISGNKKVCEILEQLAALDEIAHGDEPDMVLQRDPANEEWEAEAA